MEQSTECWQEVIQLVPKTIGEEGGVTPPNLYAKSAPEKYMPLAFFNFLGRYLSDFVNLWRIRTGFTRAFQ